MAEGEGFEPPVPCGTTVFKSVNHYVTEPLIGPLGYNVAKAIAIVIVLFWNFGINRIWTYKGIK